MNQDLLEKVKSDFWDTLLFFGPRLLYAILCLIIGLFIIKLLRGVLKRVLIRSQVELSLKSFVESLSNLVLYGLLVFAVGSVIGIESTSFIAIFGAAGIAIGLALQGSLSNFAGGLLILIFKPFKVGDLIKVNDKLGDVIKLDILYTRIRTFDGRIITMPNGNVSNSDIDNRTMEKHRRIDLKLKFNYDEDFDHLREVITEAMLKHPKIIKELDVDVRLDQIGDYEVQVVARSWVESTDYWPMYWIQLEAVKKALDQAGIEIPYPRRTVFQGELKK